MRKILYVMSLVIVVSINANTNNMKYDIESCEKKEDISSCIKLVKKYSKEKKSFLKAVFYLDRVCSYGSGDACMDLMRLYKAGHDLKQNFTLASRYLQMVCEEPEIYKVVHGTNDWHERLENCKGLGLFSRFNSKHNFKALNYYIQECQNGDSEICLKLGDLYINGKTISGIKVVKNAEKSNEFYKKSCDLDNGKGCLSYAKLLANDEREKGKTSLQSLSAVFNILLKSCELGVSKGCEEVADIYSQEKFKMHNNSKAIAYYKKGCNISNPNNFSKSCEELGRLYKWGKVVKRDFNKMIMYYKKSCKASRFKVDCKIIGDYYSWMNLYKININDMTEEYIGNNSEIATKSGEFILKSHDIDYEEAKKYYELSCSINSTWGCNGLGVLYRDGKGVRQNILIAKKYFEHGCNQGGDDKACKNFELLTEKY